MRVLSEVLAGQKALRVVPPALGVGLFCAVSPLSGVAGAAPAPPTAVQAPHPGAVSPHCGTFGLAAQAEIKANAAFHGDNWGEVYLYYNGCDRVTYAKAIVNIPAADYNGNDAYLDVFDCVEPGCAGYLDNNAYIPGPNSDTTVVTGQFNDAGVTTAGLARITDQLGDYVAANGQTASY